MTDTRSPLESLPLPPPDDALWQRWRQFVADTFLVQLDDNAMEAFKIHFRELADWNTRMNLVSIRSAGEVLWRHYADSLAVAGVIAKNDDGGRRVADLGTGAGFPGLPVAIARPDLSLTLVESITKKCTFIEHMVATLGLKNVRVVNQRAEELGQDRAFRAQFDTVLSRAVSKFSPNLEIALPLVKNGGRFLVYKTENSAFGAEGLPLVERALKTLGGTHEDTFSYDLPGADQRYCILTIRKSSATPAQYPRRPGVPEKKPL